MSNDAKHVGEAGNEPGSSTPQDPLEPGMDPAGLPDGEGKIPLSPEQKLPLPADDPLAPEDPPSAAM